MDFEFTKEQLQVRDMVREWANRAVAPYIQEWDAKQEKHPEVLYQMGELGILGLPIPERYGGSGLDYVSYGLACEELEAVDTFLRVVMSVHVGLNSLALLQWASEAQKQRWLVPQARGEKIATFGLTEPNAGSDAGATRTTARLEDGEWVVDGAKIFITNAGTDISACVTITARTGEDEVSNLIVPNGTPGYEVSPPMKMQEKDIPIRARL